MNQSVIQVNQRISILKNEKNEIIETNQIFSDLIKNQFFSICLDKYNVLNNIYKLSKNNNKFLTPIKANIINNIDKLGCNTFNNCNMANTYTNLEFSVSDFTEITNIFNDILRIMPKNTSMISLYINDYQTINPNSLSEIITAKGDKIFKILMKLESKKVLIK